MSSLEGIRSEAKNERVLELNREREKFVAELNHKKEQILKDNEVRVGAEKFVSQADVTYSELVKHTVGLVKLEDFQRIRESLDKKRQEEIERNLAKSSSANVKRKKKKESGAKLSFADDEEAPLEEEASETVTKKPKIKKNPEVDTSFLPDREREKEEERERELLKLEWLKQQEKIKQEKLVIHYSYWDGSGHREEVECKKGDTIAKFLELCKQKTEDIKGVNVENLMFVKEDLILPHTLTFYDFIINKVRGKSGPLFSFDVYDDVRLIHDASIPTEESHPGKVMQRSWYEKNKHIFPASRWVLFDPNITYDGPYTYKDKKKEQK